MVGLCFEVLCLVDMLKEKNVVQLIFGVCFNIEMGCLLLQYVGNGLNCVSCYFNVGIVGGGLFYVGVLVVFLSYVVWVGCVIMLEDCINGCFFCFMNGKFLLLGLQDMQVMLVYIEWMCCDVQFGEKVLGCGIGKIDQKFKFDLVNGECIYYVQCVVCYGVQGEGICSLFGQWVYLVLWGVQFFNIGVGMVCIYIVVVFVKCNMLIVLYDCFLLG